MLGRALVVTPALALALLLGPPLAARASTASVHTTISRLALDYAAAPNETNNVSISRDMTGSYLVEDLGTAITPGSGCSAGVDANHVICDGSGVQTVKVTLGNLDDRLTVIDSAYPQPLGDLPLTADGGPGEDTLIGGAGPDSLQGGSGDDPMIAGGGGDDSLLGEDGDDILDGGSGAENPISGGDGNDKIYGGPGDDRGLTGDPGNDVVDGGDGADDVRGNAGSDTVLGGDDDDHLEIPGKGEPDPTEGEDTLDGGPGADVLGAGATPDTGRGDATSAPDADIFHGGDGRDTVDFSQRTAPLDIDLDGRADDGESGERSNVYADVEDVIGGSNDDTLTGSPDPNTLDGRGGDDTIAGGDGDDTLVGGVNDPGGDNLSGDAGSDTMTGGPGDDELAGGDGDDNESGGGGTDTVEGEDGNDSVTGGAGGDTVNGGNGDDVLNGGEVALVGGDAGDMLNGGSGADTLLGGRGNDQLDGGLGPDYISGDAETDTVSYEDRTSKVYVTLDGLANDGERDEMDNVLPNVEKVVGGIQGDDLSGDSDNNTVDGGRGEDFIIGDLGADRLLGGDAPDVVQARDGVADEVACGDGADLVIADDTDKAIDCETRDRPGARRLIVGRYALLLPQGDYGLQLPGGRRVFQLTGNLKIPIGSTVDPTNSVMRLATARNRSGARQIALVSAGRFTVRQRGDRRPITELRLAGALPDCPGSSRRRGVAKRRPPRKLDVDIGKNKRQRARYAVRGKYSIGAATGTAWLTEDRCDGTLTIVKSGTVRVQNLERNRTKIVKAGHSYLARPR